LLESYLVLQHHCQIRVFNSTHDIPGDGNCLFYALSYLICNVPNFEELFNSTLSATRYSICPKCIKIVWASDTDYYTNCNIRYIHIFIFTNSYFCWLGYLNIIWHSL
uniref:OTU domain-containing protein n=1 Tax=Amphimedon queenslandica TaxID=400682 RepID=A0A1X7TX03_AMPQE